MKLPSRGVQRSRCLNNLDQNLEGPVHQVGREGPDLVLDAKGMKDTTEKKPQIELTRARSRASLAPS